MLRRQGDDEKGIFASIWTVGSTWFRPGSAGMRHFGRRGVVVLS